MDESKPNENNFHRFLELRTCKGELRAESEFVIEWYAAVFGQWSDNLGFFKEQIERGAFDETLKQSDIRALFNHDPNYPLGRLRASTLEAKEDDNGLWYRVKLDENVSYARDLYAAIKRGDVSQNSFSFRTIKDKWNEKGDERTLTKVALYDVGPVTFPAYPQTTVNARDLFKEIGIDYSRFSTLLFRAENKHELAATEKQELREYVKELAKRTEGMEGRAPDVTEVKKPGLTNGLGAALFCRLRDSY